MRNTEEVTLSIMDKDLKNNRVEPKDRGRSPSPYKMTPSSNQRKRVETIIESRDGEKNRIRGKKGVLNKGTVHTKGRKKKAKYEGRTH